MEILVDAGADLSIRVKALLWGESMSWETALYDVTQISYAQCGLYRQFHRREEDITAISNTSVVSATDARRRYGTCPICTLWSDI